MAREYSRAFLRVNSRLGLADAPAVRGLSHE